MSRVARLVDLLAGQAEVLNGGWLNVPVRNLEIASATMPGNLASLLRRVVLIGQPPLGRALDQKRATCTSRRSTPNLFRTPSARLIGAHRRSSPWTWRTTRPRDGATGLHWPASP
jgi:hypothetical protein